MEKVKFKHLRNYALEIHEDGVRPFIDNMGGATIAYSVVNDNEIKYAFAYCSNEDNFNKSVGRTISSGRLHSPRFVQTFQGTEKEFHEAMEH